MNQAKKLDKTMNLVSVESMLTEALAPAVHSGLATLSKFDSATHKPMKRVTLPNGGTEYAASESELFEILNECFAQSDLIAWASDAFDSMPTESEAMAFVKENSRSCLTDFGCSIETTFGEE